VPLEPGILARGPWLPEHVQADWSDEAFLPPAEKEQAADRAIADLQDRGSPAHDGLAARLADYELQDGRLRLRLQPMRWSLRLVEGDASASLSVLCVVRDAQGRWLAGRRAPWLASWPGRWALGAAGAVELGENPVGALWRELEEEWSVRAEQVSVEALALLPNRLAMLVGQAWLPEGAEVVADDEHDEHAWWPPDPEAWPDDAAPELRRMAQLLG
jgi:8-oxo-dGTP diphosphatase